MAISKYEDYPIPQKGIPMQFDALTKLEGDPMRHIEQLWDEIKKSKERLSILERYICKGKE